jgi:type IV pilus assembly protein PilX
MKTQARLSRQSQRGAVLIISLILLAIMTLLGLALLRGTLLGERMGAGMYDRGLGFQAAEAGLREAETFVQTKPTFPTSGCVVATGLCATPVAGAVDRWKDASFAGWKTAAANVGTLGIKPQYFVENMGPAPNWVGCDQEVPMQANCLTPRYRITSRSSASNRAAVILQSNYAAP